MNMVSASKKELLDLIKRRGKISIDESVAETGLAKTTIREHFSQLENEGFIYRNVVRSGPGRPSLQYFLTNRGHSLYPSYEPELMRELIKFLKSNGEELLLEEFFEAFWDKRYKETERLFLEHAAVSEEEKMQVLMDMLEREGFMPAYELNKKNETAEIHECNCPFTEIVKETRLPCKLEKQFFERLFNKEVERTSYIPDGDHSCSYCIS